MCFSQCKVFAVLPANAILGKIASLLSCETKRVQNSTEWIVVRVCEQK